jgi:hypothetical protein
MLHQEALQQLRQLFLVLQQQRQAARPQAVAHRQQRRHALAPAHQLPLAGGDEREDAEREPEHRRRG